MRCPTVTYLLTGEDRALVTLPAVKVHAFSTSPTTPTVCGAVTAFHGLVPLAIATQVTVPCSTADPLPLGKATVHAPPLSLGAIGRPYAALSMLCCTAMASRFS